jgi:hypothetical protein
LFKDFASEIEAERGLIKAGIVDMSVEIRPVFGKRYQPIVLCEFESDAERIQARGFNARMIREYSAD